MANKTHKHIPADSFREIVFSHLRSKILLGELAPDDCIHIETLSRELNVSRAPIRDALIALEAQGFISVKPHKGYYVTPMGLDYFQNCLDTVGMFLEECILKNHAKIDTDLLAHYVNANQQALADRDIEGFRDSLTGFAHTLMAVATNPINKHFFHIIWGALHPMITLEGLEKVLALETREDHKARIVRQLRKGNYRAAASIVRHELYSYHNEHNRFFFETRA